MSLFGALSASLTALTAQSSAVNVISNNISNLSTTGFKSTSISFSTLVAGNVGGGVLQGLRNDIDRQGAINSTNVATDLAVQGNGFFTVSDIAGGSFYTRAGSFRTDKDGNLVNEANYRLRGWPLDSQARIPGEGKNPNSISNQDIRSLEEISTKSITGRASPTTRINTKVNLRAEEEILEGAGGTIDMQSSANTNNTSNDIIVPKDFANGDGISLTLGSGVAYTFDYGGIAKSDNITSGTGIGGATSATETFSTSPFTNGVAFKIQSSSMSSPVTFTFKSTSNTNLNEFRNLNELSQVINAVDGLRARVSDGVLYVAADNANNGLTFTDVSSSGLVAALGFDDDSITTVSDNTRFATLGNLANLVNDPNRTEIKATLINPSGNATLKIFNVDPTDTITFSDSVATVGGYGTVGFVGSSNTSNTSTDIIIPNGSGSSLTALISGGTSYTFDYGGVASSDDITAGSGIGGVTSASSTFTTSPFTNGAAFTIKSSSMSSAVTYTFNSSSDTSLNQFKSLNELATIVNSTTGLNARVSSGVLYVAADDANDGLTFADVSSSGLVAGLGFDDDTITSSSSGTRFATLSNLSSLVNASTGLSATINNPAGNSTLTISNTDLTKTLSFTDSIGSLSVATTAAVTDTNQMLTEFGLTSSTINEVYDATGAGGSNMASGKIAPDFSRTITIYDSLGRSLDLRIAFTKIADSDTNQTWAVELYSVDPNAITGAVSVNKNDGLLAFGKVNFNGDGTLNSVQGTIGGNISINPSGGASTQTLSLSLGTAGDLGTGKSDGLSQFAGAYSSDVSQNGFPTGRLQSLQIDSQGYVTAVFDNSLTSKVYKLPLAYFSNPNALTAEAGNAYSSNNSSGDPRFGEIGNPAVGTIVPGALEVSTAEIGKQLTDLIVAQQAYSASTNVLKKVTDLFEQLRNL